MLMTIDGTNDDLICIDGVEKYTFTDADAGDLPANEASDDDDDDDSGGGGGGAGRAGRRTSEQDEQDEQEQGRSGGGGCLGRQRW
jgi:hypothetical protein